jgi:hypothetical protein
MNRYQASLTHFGISLTVATLVFLAIRFLWYPGPLFETAGGVELLLVIIGVDVTLGPLITLIIFKPGKWGLRFDLTVIACLQVAALVYGLWAIAESRPVYITFVKDRFELVRAGELEDRDLAQAAGGFGSLPLFGYRIVGAQIPKNPAEQLRLMDSAIVAGRDIQYFPRYYVDYQVVAPEAARHAAPLARLRKLNPGLEGEVDAIVGGRPESELGFLPIRAGKRDMTVLVEKPSGRVVALLSLNPWEY